MRRSKPRLPEFKPPELLRPGDAFNPYREFESWSVARALAGFRKLSPSAKWVYHVLAMECFTTGYDSHAQAELAVRVGLSVDQFQRHLWRLKKLHLVHIE